MKLKDLQGIIASIGIGGFRLVISDDENCNFEKKEIIFEDKGSCNLEYYLNESFLNASVYEIYATGKDSFLVVVGVGAA